MRGPGESQIETDRRLILNKIIAVKRQAEAYRSGRTKHSARTGSN